MAKKIIKKFNFKFSHHYKTFFRQKSQPSPQTIHQLPDKIESSSYHAGTRSVRVVNKLFAIALIIATRSGSVKTWRKGREVWLVELRISSSSKHSSKTSNMQIITTFVAFGRCCSGDRRNPSGTFAKWPGPEGAGAGWLAVSARLNN